MRYGEQFDWDLRQEDSIGHLMQIQGKADH